MSFGTTQSLHILIFVALLLMHDGVDGAQITGLSPRRGTGHGGGGGDGPPSTSSPLPSQTSSIGPINTPSSNIPSRTSSLPSQTSGIGFLSSSTSSLPASTSKSEASLASSRHIGTIVGATLGSIILAGLGLMSFAYFRRRARFARKQPRGSFFEPIIEMSQTQNGPPLTSFAPLIHNPEPVRFFDASSRNDTVSSLSPLIPANDSHDPTSHPPLPTSEPVDNSQAPSNSLKSPFEAQPFLLPDIRRPESAVPASASGQLSPLHRDMTGFQKTLEADYRTDMSNQDHSTDKSDPPPEYID